MHLVYPPKFCISIVFNFSSDACNTQGKWKTKVMKIGGGGREQIRCIMGDVQVTYRPFPHSKNSHFQNEAKCKNFPVLDFQKKIFGPAGPQVFIFCHQHNYCGRQKIYLRINGFNFVKDNGLSLVYVYPKKKVTYILGARLATRWENLVATE